MKFWIKLVIFPMVIMLLVSTLGLLFMAGITTYKGLEILISGKVFTQEHSGAGVYFLQSLDIVLGTIVTLVLMIGIISLFDLANQKKLKSLPDWLHVTDFKHLKILLWETILLAMVVFFFGHISNIQEHAEWKLLILPISIALLSVGVYFVRKK